MTTYRVGYRYQGKLCWTHALDTPEAAVEVKELFESRGVELARATLAAVAGRGPTTAPRLSEMLEKHLRVVASYASSGTVDGYRRMAARTWLPRLGDFPVDAVEREHVTDWIKHQRTVETKRSMVARRQARKEGRPEPEPKYYAPSSIQDAQSFLSDVFDAAVEGGHITKNVAAGVKLPSDHAKPEMVFLTTAEYARLLDKVDPWWQPFVSFLVGTGCRWGEATALYAHDFTLDSAFPAVHISRAWKKGPSGTRYLGSPKSAKAIRTIRLPRSLVDRLRPVIEETPEGKFVFRGKRGGVALNTNFHANYWKRAVTAADLGKRPRVHDLRHTHVSWLIEAGVPLPVIQRRLGHENIATTVDTYGHLTPDAHWGAAEAADAALSEALPQIEG
ncbi:tyrosine-type recombinase/integrase [Myceligenerans halotolerans]